MRTHFSQAMRLDAAATFAPRIAQAYADFAAMLQSIVPMPDPEAARLARAYVAAKLAKLDPVLGRIIVRHGGFLDSDCVATVRANVSAGKVRGV